MGSVVTYAGTASTFPAWAHLNAEKDPNIKRLKKMQADIILYRTKVFSSEFEFDLSHEPGLASSLQPFFDQGYYVNFKVAGSKQHEKKKTCRLLGMNHLMNLGFIMQ